MPTGICKLCFKPIGVTSFATLFDSRLTVCDRCYRDFHPRFHHFSLDGIKALAIYDYDDTIREKLYLFKGCGDYELKDIFLERFRFYLRIVYHSYTIVPIPSWHQDDESRGYNHVEAMFQGLGLSMCPGLIKTRPHKQSSLPFLRRSEVSDILAWKQPLTIEGQRILLVDDVMTSGSSLKAGLNIIRNRRPSHISILVMSKTIDRAK